MRIGTKSLLVGAHQGLWHPFTVLLAWIELYGLPNWKEAVCIVIHDWGYWGKKNIDGGPTLTPFDGFDYEEGFYHPCLAGEIASDYLDEDPEVEWSLGGWNPDSNNCFERDPSHGNRVVIKKTQNRYSDLCLLHSRAMAKSYGKPPSRLCWADKLAVKYDPWFLYLPRVWISGEIHEFRAMAHALGEISSEQSDITWYCWARQRTIRKAYARDATPAYRPSSEIA